ncbi:hypothetical protein DEU52_14617 [Ensifer adhaerens]|nr:hypothetical protein DEU52_14617 [Ensifer adhaerens]
MAPGETASMDERTDAWEKRMPSWLQKEEEAQATSCTFSRTMARDWRGSVETAKVAASAAMASASKAPDDRDLVISSHVETGNTAKIVQTADT